MQNRVASMPINIERPRSALLRGVHITEFKGHVINPDPIILQETDLLLEEFLSPTKLKALTGANDLNRVEFLEMIVDTSETSLGNFGMYLPNLKQLKLNGSHVPRIRDLGTSLVNLRVLWLARSSLVDLDGVPALHNLRELYLAYNEITDLSPCSMLEHLECLDLEGNLIDDVKQIEFLNLCTHLSNLTLYGNPICVKPSPDVDEPDLDYSYRHEIIKILPNLQILDDELTLNTKPLSPRKEIKPAKEFLIAQAKPSIDQQCPFDDDWQLINEILDQGIGLPEENLAINESVRPGTSSSRGNVSNSSVRPLSALRPLSSFKIRTAHMERPKTTRNIQTSNSASGGGASRGGLSSAGSSARPSTDPISDITNDASHLTVGPTLQGNPLKALLARKKQPRSHDSPIPDYPDGEEVVARKPPTYKAIMESLGNSKDVELENKELRDEISKWRKDHAKKLEERKEYFEPQVLKIEDDVDEQPLSDNDEADYYPMSSIVSSKSPGLVEITSAMSVTSVSSNLYDESIVYRPVSSSSSISSSRPKTAFKQSFDYERSETKKEIKVPHGKETLTPLNSSVDKSSEEKSEKKRSKSKEKRHHHHKKSGHSRRSPSPSGSSGHTSSRAATGDTGYSSSTSSFASYKLKSLDSHHQPIIISNNLATSSSLSGSNSNLNASSLSSSMKQHSSPLSTPLSPTQPTRHLTALKQLKTNLAPLTGPIKLPSNNKI